MLVSRERHRLALLALAAASALGGAGCGDADHTAGRLRAALDPSPPSVAWPESTPEAEGLDGQALERLARDLARAGTRSFLVARRGRVVAEWNAWRQRANEPQHLAALAKPVVGATAYLHGQRRPEGVEDRRGTPPDRSTARAAAPPRHRRAT